MLEKGIPLSWDVLRLTFASLTSALDRSKMFAVLVPSAMSKNFTHGVLYIDTWISNPRKKQILKSCGMRFASSERSSKPMARRP